METVKLSSRGQIVIPKDVRETAHLTEGMEFSVVYVDGQIRLTPVPMVEPTTYDGIGSVPCFSADEKGRPQAALLYSNQDWISASVMHPCLSARC